MYQNALLVLVVVVVFCRIQLSRAGKELSMEQRLETLRLKPRLFQYVVYLAVLFAGVYALRHFQAAGEVGSAAYYGVASIWFVLLLVVGAVFRVVTFRRLKRAGFPAKYLRTSLWTTTLIYLALVAFFAVTVLG